MFTLLCSSRCTLSLRSHPKQSALNARSGHRMNMISYFSSDTANENDGKPKKRGRRRHRFSNTRDIPSFADFQQQTQVRALYRQYTRLVLRTSTDATNARELQSQIRRDFRLSQQDSWHVKRAISEGTRRYKELSAMLGSSVKRDGTPAASASPDDVVAAVANKPPASTTNQWPWNRECVNGKGDIYRASPYPPKSNL